MTDSGNTLAIISLGGLLLNSDDSGALTPVEGAVGGADVSGTAGGSDGARSGDTRQALTRAALSNAKKITIVFVGFTANFAGRQ